MDDDPSKKLVEFSSRDEYLSSMEEDSDDTDLSSLESSDSASENTVSGSESREGSRESSVSSDGSNFHDASEIIEDVPPLAYDRLENKPRIFQGNINYLRFYQAEKRRFTSFTSSFGTSNLVGTSISASGFRYRHRNINNKAGSYWSAEEKDTFFELLARYSIHRADLIHENLPSKSISSILGYYKLLKRELQQYKRHKRRLLRLVSYDEIPVCHEMSEEFIEMEESQAFLLKSVSNMRDSDSNFRFKKTHPGLNDQDLVDYDRMNEMSNAVFVNNELLDPVDGMKRKLSKPLVLDEESKFVLRQIVKNMTYEIILTVLENKVENEQDMTFVEDDIYRALAQMKVSRPIKLKDYWSNIGWRLGLDVGRKLPSGTQRLDKLTPYAVNDQDTPQKSIESIVVDQDGDQIEQVMDGSMPFESAILKPTPVESLDDRTPHVEQDDQILDQLAELESALLERKDREESIKYENQLLHYLSCREDQIMLNDAELVNKYIDAKYQSPETNLEQPNLPQHANITNEMLFLHTFDYATYNDTD
ncbi:hypothetical protein OGAPHI_007002 [Ogataea philodendri]|uniref:Myb-like domain-containing protein n=2 Tax=Ogataea TaxID=461281 RepID=A0A9P8NWB8_9ASCO|nr:uncharacterized protein OGAPHI_007002 [Ogataea philodendri]KAH3660416.1 hypothetical protein OGAPHI_007002 [Ogataea philodendri]